ncbi:MAG: alkaline phosphatase PhoX [Woeseia sp.]
MGDTPGMLDRRHFLQALLVAAAAPAACAPQQRHRASDRFGKLRPDPRQILDLPAGFRYDILSRKGDEMDDGVLVPGEADGMAAFAAEDGRIALVCNHENPPSKNFNSPFGSGLERMQRLPAECVYDRGNGVTPGTGGTTTILYDPQSRRTLHRHLSLAGTELNCAGGPTPWGSWLSCEECFRDPGADLQDGREVSRERRCTVSFRERRASCTAEESCRRSPLPGSPPLTPVTGTWATGCRKTSRWQPGG